jgi:ATP-dependent RNA helicase DDX46/PRP5
MPARLAVHTLLWLQVEVLARQVLNNPVEIQVGGRSVVNKDITQFVELRPEEDRFLRLLEVLGEW